MARTASIAVAGYFPTPSEVTPRIAGLFSVTKREKDTYNTDYVFLDPCAGEGEAIVCFADIVLDKDRRRVEVYACEMEESRFNTLKARTFEIGGGYIKPVHGDAFQLNWEKKGNYCDSVGATLLYLNPPYDLDSVHGRLEERFLQRFHGALCEDGYLVFLVPFYALKASARTLAQHFCELHCFRFPEEDFSLFKQVCLIAKKRTLLQPDPAVIAQVEGWSSDSSSIPELPTQTKPLFHLPVKKAGFGAFAIARLDLQGLLAKAKPWHTTDRGGRISPVSGIFPQGQAIDVLTRTYPVAMPPRPAHIAAGIAAGVFNGARINPDNELSGLPPILVKGAFDREFKTVEEKKNKDGDTTAEVQIQQPRLVVTALDLRAKTFHTIRSSADRTNATTVADMTTGDLLTSYGRGLMQVMLDHCPVMHDPSHPDHQITLPKFPRKLFKAQEQATMVAVKLLGGVHASKAKRRGAAAFILGEIGSGKSTVALATAETIQAKRILVMCPPHLLDGWRDQTTAVLPWAKVMVLTNVADVDKFAQDTCSEPIVAILSREQAKLGHAWASVQGQCPRCGSDVPSGDLAKTRERCPHRPLLRLNDRAKLASKMAMRLMPVAADSPVVRQVFRSRGRARLLEAYARKPEDMKARWPLTKQSLRPFVPMFTQHRGDQAILMGLLHAIGDDSLTAETLKGIYAASLSEDTRWSSRGEDVRSMALLLPVEQAEALLDEMTALTPEPESMGSVYYSSEKNRNEAAKRMVKDFPSQGKNYMVPDLVFQNEALLFRGAKKGSVEAATAALGMAIKSGSFGDGIECGEPLFQAIPEPRRFPLATYISKRAPNSVDLFILDEGHEYSGEGSAQGFAAHRLTGLGIPTLNMTGSVMNGYAESLFNNQWAMDPEFRREFARDQRQEYIRRYGYLKQLVEKKEDGKTVSFGTVTDRVETSIRTVGSAPGVLPLFVLKYLLRLAVTLHKADLAIDLPPCRDIVERVTPSAEQLKNLESLKSKLMDQIRKDQFGPLAGKLWGQMAELPSYLDRATIDTGNGHGDHYVVAYPESEGAGMVAMAPLLPASTLLPKEEWMLAKVKAELAEGRRVMLFTWHTALMPRIARLIEEHLGETCPVLDAGKVAASKRQAWIDKEVIKKDRRVLVVNPVAVQTGLNNLIWFSTEIWMENPACNAIVLRQAKGRVDRIGQTKETRIIFPIYVTTPQENLHKLLLHKVAVSMSTDGLDAESALQAAGVGETQAMSVMAVGRQLYEMLSAS